MAGEPILIIAEDVEARTWLIESVIRPAGYVTAEAANCEEARAQIAQFKPELIVFDAPVGLDGGLAFLSEHQASIPIVVTTPHPSLDEVSAVLSAGACDVLVKPFELDRLTTSIARALQTSQAIRERDVLRQQTADQAQEFNALYTVGKKVAGLLDIEEILTLVVTAAVNLTRAEEGSLMLLDPNTGELYLRANRNLAESNARNMRVKVTDTLMGRVIQTGRPIMMSGNDLVKVQTWFLVKAILSVPLIVGDRVTGVLSVDNRVSSRAFSKHEVHLLSTLADSAAIAIETARLYWEVETERAKLDTILRDIQDVVIVTDPDMRILRINNAAREAFGLGDDVLTGRLLAEVIQIPAVLDLFDQPELYDRNWRAEVVLQDGRTLQGQLSSLDGVGYGVVMQDISRLKELDRIKSEFVSIVSHDLRTPLTTIHGYVSLLPRVGPLNEQQQEFMTRIERNMTNIVNLVADLLDIGRIEAGLDWEMEPIALHHLVLDSAQQLQVQAAAKKQTLTADAPELPMTLGNARRLEQVITNLIGNAIKYTPDGGQIDVSLREDGDFLVIQVRDNGIGIAIENQRHIFDKFYRVESEATASISGSGLGLSIVKAIVEKHMGRVWAESELGQGSTFTMLLPKHLKRGAGSR